MSPARGPFRCLVVDDEPIAHRIIDDYCRALPHLQPVRHAFDAMQAMGMLAEESFDLLLLDLNMPRLGGFDFLRSVQLSCPVIVTTAHAEHALEGFELHVCDYLLKPVSFERFVKAVNRALPPVAPAACEAAPAPGAAGDALPRSLFIKGDRKHHQLALADIRYVEACGNYCVVRANDGSIITPQSLSGMERSLPAEQFLRVHKSYLVAIARIRSVSATSLQVGDDTVPIGPSYRKQVFARLQIDGANG
ncbi:LytR/AlgR family response regulator transcription factor [Pseudomarimonas salicorniae]|uniref:LytTR family DNA-binding domain-containing protein n=1 Tax=Pseudomarimonas salicorniae TaxID=2933270 RepID=A0ABT0GD04_9GAMM|nr:LytTR family DNA-binding domain-containing protein [Lysobacter sp. CAU 1642]MCK7592064.1 LytTR family DNA-binding domain-containing protein [Lysobacter sp. CAU 1642]